jgi:hypothetical protein
VAGGVGQQVGECSEDPQRCQTAYAGFMFCLQNKWQYIQRMVADAAPFFAPFEAEICTSFLPALLDIPSTEINGGYHQLLTHGVKQGGLAIRNPVDTAPSIHLPHLRQLAI